MFCVSVNVLSFIVLFATAVHLPVNGDIKE